MRLSVLLVSLFLSVFLHAGLAAQSSNTSAVLGRVTTPEGDPIGDVQVVLVHGETGTRHGSLSTPSGRFYLRLLPPGGPYTLTVSALGYGTVTREDILLRPGETLPVEVELREEAIPVEGIQVRIRRDPVFEMSQIGPRTLLDERTVQSMPILSRDLTELAVLSPLVTTGTEEGGFSIAGQNERYNAILVDGIQSKDVMGLTAGGVPGGQAGAKLLPIDAVDQFEVMVAPFDVRLSGFTGGVMNAVTKTGTNRWSGSGFAYLRTEGLTGDLSTPGGLTSEPSEVSRDLFGFSLGGPLVRDRVHLFVSAEFEERSQPPPGFNLGRDNPILTRVNPDSMVSITEVMQDTFAVNPGSFGVVGLERSLGNLFARLDWQIDPDHRLTLRHVFADAQNDETPNRTTFDAYEMMSNAVFRESTTNNTSVQLLSTFGEAWSNEAKVSLQRTSDATTPMVDWPQVEIDVFSSFPDNLGLVRPIRAGAEFFAQANDLDQTVLQLTDNLSASLGDHTVTFGVSTAIHEIDQLFIPGSRGFYRFESTRQFAGNDPSTYEITLLEPDADPRIGFTAVELGSYIQDEFRATEDLTLRYGIRLDIPLMPDRPDENLQVQRLFGKSTRAVPTAQLIFSPRFGFNWTTGGEERTTQLRGGAGIFLGRIPFVWLASAFANTGLRTRTVVCGTGTGFVPPGFDPTRGPPTECADGPGRTIRNATLFGQDFQFPQNLRVSLGVDHRLDRDLSVSGGFVFSRALNQMFLEDINIGPAVAQDSLPGYTLGFGGRPNFGRPTFLGYDPIRLHSEMGSVVKATNRSEDYSYAFTGELRGTLFDRLAFQAAYSYQRSFDRQSLTSVDLFSNFGLNPVQGHPNIPEVRPSRFDRPHKVVATVSGAPLPGLDDTRISLLYTGQSGLPFSYVYRSDLNGDGWPGPGPAFDRNNDLLFVPKDPSSLPVAGFGTIGLMANAINEDECLSEHVGRTIPRNACRAPWQNRLDLRVDQGLEVGGLRLRLQADVINVLNLMSQDWGQIRRTESLVPLLETVGRAECFMCIGDLQARWSSGVLPERDPEGRLRASEPWVTAAPASQWQAQLGVRVEWR